MTLKSTDEIFRQENMPEGHDKYAVVTGTLRGRIGFLLSSFERCKTLEELQSRIRMAFEDICTED